MPVEDLGVRASANSMVENGILLVAAAGSNGGGVQMGDPASAAFALSVVASNDVNELTEYSNRGFKFLVVGKPDVTAPGGSLYHSDILSAETNAPDFALSRDTFMDDYRNSRGTSMASAFVAGSAALVIEALESEGHVWSYTSGRSPKLVKMLLSASATETNRSREGGSGFDPTLGRATIPRDTLEGFGIINPDAAIEAVKRELNIGELDSGGGVHDRRATGWHTPDFIGFKGWYLILDVPPTADCDIYVYRASPDQAGSPVLVSASDNPGLGVDERLLLIPPLRLSAQGEALCSTGIDGGCFVDSRYVFVKLIEGFGSCGLDLNSLVIDPRMPTLSFWGMITLVILLLMAGLLTVHRRHSSMTT